MNDYDVLVEAIIDSTFLPDDGLATEAVPLSAGSGASAAKDNHHNAAGKRDGKDDAR